MKIGHQSIFSKDNEELFVGGWNPKALLEVIKKAEYSLHGKRILDIGGNTGGLAVELARYFDCEVTVAEPGKPQEEGKNAIRNLIADEGLKINLTTDDLYSCFKKYNDHDFDAVVCFGLLYHFRNPQDILDRLNSIAKFLFLSCQTHPGSSPFMMNRICPGVMPVGFFNEKITLTGWHPTKSCLEKMLNIAGYTNPVLLTPRSINFPRKLSGLTNSTYYFAARNYTLDSNVNSIYYPR